MSKRSSISDQDVVSVKRANEGSVQGLQTLYEKYFPAIYRFCFWQTNSSEDAEDLTQEVFIAMTKSLPKFRGEASFKNWLYQIAKNIIARWISHKAKGKTVALFDTIIDSAQWIDPENELYKQKVVKKLLKALKPEERKILSYRFLRNFSVLETAHTLKMTESKIKVASHRALKKLQKMFENPPKA